jgi:S1-C subfamily serine protease
MVFNPTDQIVPLLAINATGGVQQFLGTSCFIQPGPVLVTADHVIGDWDGALAIVHPNDLTTLFPATVTRRDRAHDLAVLTVDGYRPPHPFIVSTDDDLRSSDLVVCMEYGNTTQGGSQITVQSATRVGNVTRLVDLKEVLGLAGDGALELSFPALRGASGAPVLSNGEYRLRGILVANHAYHLLPTQIESVYNAVGTVEETTRFMMPMGIAVHVRHLRPLLGI